MFHAQWTPLVTPHLVGDTLIILMAKSGENAILITTMVTLIVFDGLAAMAIIDSLVLKAIYVQIALTLGGIFIFFGATQKKGLTKKDDFENTESTYSTLPPKQNPENASIMKRKSKKLHFWL